MGKTLQFKIASLCLLACSKTVFASDLPIIGVASKALKPAGIAGLPTLTQPPRPTRPGATFPLKNPPPRTPAFFDFDKKLPGTFGSPSEELFKRNIPNARASCIQAAIQSGDEIPVNDSSVWEFANKGPSARLLPPRSSPVITSIQLKMLGSGHTPAALATGDACNNDIRHSACVSLLSKAMTEVTQAYHKSALNTDTSVWREVLSFLGLMPLDGNDNENMNIIEALKKAQDGQNKESHTNNSIDLSPLENEDPLLLASQLLIQKIDESLARGDKEGADKAKDILEKINPSAEHAVNCVLGNVKLGGLNDNLDPNGRPQGSYFGPLSGIDYGKQNTLITHGSALSDTTAVITVGLAIVYAIKDVFKSFSDAEKEKKEDAKHKEIVDAHKASTEAQKEATRSANLRDYLNCKGAICDKLYPIAAAQVKAANEGTKPGGPAAPGRPAEKGPDDMWAPSVKQDPLPPGSGGGSGELVPWENMPIKVDNSERVGAQNEWQKHHDPQAIEHFCQKTVQDFKSFAIKKITNSGRPIVTSLHVTDLPIPSEPYGIVDFEKWDNAYWTEQKKNREFDPEYQDKENNCHAMDEVQGL
jgi:hypothetical protein